MIIVNLGKSNKIIKNPIIRPILRKIVSKKQIDLIALKEIRKRKIPFAIYCNTDYVKNLLEIAEKKRIIDKNISLITYNVIPPKFFVNSKTLTEKINLENIEIIYCFDFGKNGNEIDLLYNKLSNLNQKIVIEDQTAFPKKRDIKNIAYRNLIYSLDKNTVIPSHFANDAYINELKNIACSFKQKITYMDICAGQGSIGLSLINELKNIEMVNLVEINPKQIAQIKKTLKNNQLPKDKVQIFQSNVLDSFPKEIKIDLVSCNPPHVNRKAKSVEDKQGADEGWAFHKKFFKQIVNYMSDESIVTLIEYKGGSSKETFENMLGSKLLISKVIEIKNTPWYILCIKKRIN